MSSDFCTSPDVFHTRGLLFFHSLALVLLVAFCFSHMTRDCVAIFFSAQNLPHDKTFDPHSGRLKKKCHGLSPGSAVGTGACHPVAVPGSHLGSQLHSCSPALLARAEEGGGACDGRQWRMLHWPSRAPELELCNPTRGTWETSQGGP